MEHVRRLDHGLTMIPIRHVFVCNSGKACMERDSAGVYERFRKLYKESGLKPNVLVTGCGSVGFCDRGVAVIVYPEQVWYSRVTPADVDEIWSEHATQLAGLESMLKTYEVMIAEKSEAQNTELDALVVKRNNNELKALVEGAKCGKK